MGKAIVSTPYWYAEEMLSDNCWLLVYFGDVDGFKKYILYLIENPKKCNIIRENAYYFGRKMTWKTLQKNIILSSKTLNDYITYP